MKYPIHLVCLLLGTLSAIAMPAAQAVGAEPAAEAAGGPLEFRRVYAPADQLKDWPRDSVRYVPMKPEEFERLVDTARAAGSAAPLATASITSAEYRANLDSSGALRGEATLDVAFGADRSAMLPLEPCGLAITQASWLGAEPQPAELGLGVDGKLAVLVKRSGDLRLEWSLRGRQVPDGAEQFDLELPACPASCLLLELPSNLQPAANPGLVTRESSDDSGRTHWRIELGGHPRAALRIAAGKESEPRQPLTLVRYALAYALTLHGLDLSAELKLDIHNEPLREIVVALDPRLELVKAQLGDTAIPWSLLSPANGQAARVLLQLPKPLQGAGHVLRLGAVAPLELNRPWRLPAIRTEGMFWQEGNATIGVRAPLSLEQLVPVRGRQSKTGTLSGPRRGESAEIQYFAEDAGVEVVLAQSRVQLQIESGTSIELSSGEITGRVVAELSVTDGELFQLEADIGRQWLIDSVEAEPSEVLHDGWSVNKGNGDGEKLAVHLEKALSPARPVRLLITGRRLHAPSGQPLSAEDLTPLRFADVAARRRLLAVHAVEPYRLKLDQSERLKRFEPEKLTPAERRLFSQPPRALVFENDAGAASLAISLVSPKPSYSATIRAEATALASTTTGANSPWLRESYWLRCVPDATRVDRVLVHFCSPRATPPKWSLGTGTEGQFEARRLSAAEQASALMDTRGETWELVFQQPRSGPFEIHASRLVEWKGKEPVSLVCVPEAAQQHGSLVIRAMGAAAIRIHNDRLDSLPLEDAASEQISTARARFRYSPMSDAVRADQPAVTLEMDKATLPAAWIGHCQLESRYQADGAGRHSAIYYVESNGAPRLDLTLPDSADLGKVAGVWSDGQPASWQIVGNAADRHMTVELPDDRRFPVVCIQYQTQGKPLGMGTVLEPELPRIEVPVFAQQWTVWLPPGYDAGVRGLFSLAQPNATSSWSERIFGPLGRPAAAAPFDPLATDSWAGLVGGDTDLATARQWGQQFLQRLSECEQTNSPSDATASGSAKTAKLVTWGDLLGRAAAGMNRPLLIDGPALSRMRLDARSLVVTVRADAPLARGIALLQQAGLALLVFPQGLLLTGAGDASSYHPHLVPLEGETLWQVRSGALAEQLRQALAAREDATFVPIQRWQQQPAAPTVPWHVSSAADQSLDTLGWTVYRTVLLPGAPVQLSVVRLDTVRSFQWAVFLAVFALLWWITRARPAVSIGVFAVGAAAALVLAEPYAAMASGAVLGALAALVLALVRRKSLPEDRSQAHTPESQLPTLDRTSIRTTAVLLLVLGVVCWTSAARGADAPDAPRNVYQVLIPVDGQQQPNGANYFVPEGLYQQLQRKASDRTEPPQGWLLRGAVYRGTLTRQTTPEQLAVSELKAAFDLEVFQPQTRIRLPLGREGVNLLPDGATLDGRVIQVEWQEGDGALVFDVGEIGAYRLELSLRPTIKMFGTSYGMDLRIPRLPTSRLELNLPSDAPAIEIPTATGSVSYEQVPPRLVAELGASDQLAIRWPDVTGSTRLGPALDVEELVWLKVHPGSVVLSTRLKLKVVEGAVRQLRLAVDPRLRILPFRDPDSPVGQVQTTPGEPQIVQLDMVRPVSDQGVVEANFLLAGTSGIGNVRLPQIQVMDARVTKRWMAVSVDRALVYEEQAADRLEPVAVPVFEAAWGKAEGPPALAYNLPASQPAWSLATRPDEPRITVDQLTALSFAPGSARIEFEAQVATTGYAFQYHLSAPKQLRVDGVRVSEDSVQRTARWSRDGDGGITVFLSEPVSGRQQLSVQGRMNTPIRGPAALPVLRVDGSVMHTCAIQVFREPSVLLNVTEIKGLTEVERPVVGDDKVHLGRLVKWYTVADASQPVSATVNLTPNQPEMVADQTTYLRAEAKAWEAEVDLRVKVSRDVVDEFRIQVPAQWSGPYRIDPPATYRVVESSSKGRPELVIRPQMAVDGEYRVRVSGPLAVEPGERLSAPSIRLLDADRGKSLLVLPRQLETQPIKWETRGLKPVELPPGLAASPADAQSLVAYELETNSFQAVLNLVDRTRRAPNVLLTDIHLAWQLDGSYQGLAWFDLEPAGLVRCPLHLPPGARLICVRVDGVPSQVQQESQDHWQVPLHSDVVPQRIEVLFQGQLSSPIAAGVCPLAAPSLGNTPTARALWSISGPSEIRMGLPDGAEETDPLEMDLVRLQEMSAVVELIQSLSMRPEEPEKTDQWQAIWRRRWEACRERMRQEFTGEQQRRHQALGAELDALDRKEKSLRSRLPRSSGSAPETIEPLAFDPPQLWQGWVASPRTTIRCVTAPGIPTLSVTLQYRQADPWRYRLLWACGVVLFVPLLAVGRVRQSAFRLSCRWPAAVGVAAGLAWWLWLEPSILGGLWILLTLAVSLVPAWRRMKLRSSVVPVE